MSNATDPFYNYPNWMGTPARNGAAVTPSDSADLDAYAKAVYVGASGDVTVTLTNMADGTFIKFSNHPVGYMPVQVKRVWSTGTTATLILALYDYGTLLAP